MQTTPSLPRSVAAWFILAGILACSPAGFAAPMAPKAQLRGLAGRAQSSHAGGTFQAVRKGAAFEAGDVIQTAGASAADLDFGAGIGTLRLTESTTLVIEKWSVSENGYELSLFLRDGEMLGRVGRPATPSRFEVKVNSGIGAVVEGQFRLDARGNFVLLDGKAAFVHTPPGREPAAHALSAPPAKFFSPAAGVRTAPAELVKEVNSQWRSKLPKP